MTRASASAGKRPALRRLPIVAAGMISLAAAVAGGLMRLGWSVGLPSGAVWHGALMIGGFFGTVIGLERAVALGRRWAYLGPVASGVGGIALLAGWTGVGVAAITAGSAVLSAATWLVWRRLPSMFTLTLSAGAASWLVGNLVWAGAATLPAAIAWWIGFLVLTIAGERLELSRFLPTSRAAHGAFAAIAAVLVVAMLAATVRPAAGLVLQGAALAALALWLLRYDLARRTVRMSGLTRFVAVSLLSGYVWLLAGGVLLMVAPGPAEGAGWDAALHALMLGFVFSMVFGHAPLIFPAVLQVSMPYHPWSYVALVLLHASVGARVAGDLFALHALRAGAGAASAAALALFVLSTLAAVVRGRGPSSPGRSARSPSGAA